MSVERAFTKTVLSSKLNNEIKESILSTKCTGVSFNESTSIVKIYFSEELTPTEETSLTNIVNNHVPTPTFHYTMVNYLSKDVYEFVKQLRLDFAADNIELGITQLGKTRVVADKLRDLNYYLDVFSLYAAVQVIDEMIAEGLDPADAPFITELRMTEFKNKILQFLGS